MDRKNKNKRVGIEIVEIVETVETVETMASTHHQINNQSKSKSHPINPLHLHFHVSTHRRNVVPPHQHNSQDISPSSLAAATFFTALFVSFLYLRSQPLPIHTHSVDRGTP